MKKIVSIIALVAVCSTTVFATVPLDKKKKRKKALESNAMISQEDEEKFSFTLIDEKGEVDVSIYAENGKKVFEDKISYKKPFKKVYDFSTQEGGVYTFDIDGDVDMEQEVFYSELHKEDVYTELEESKDGKVSLFVRHDDTPVKVKITDDKGRILYSRTYLQDSNFKQTFDLSKFSAQDIQMTISGKKSFISYGL